jgi:hypothetical protein
MSWLKQHLADFVYPVIGEQEITPLGYFTKSELTVIKNAWRAMKRFAAGSPILLPGRDVFVFEILARRENYPTLFMPQISRKTVVFYSETMKDLGRFCLLDTGFAGTIPRALHTPRFKLMSYNQPHSDIHLFPRLTLSRPIAVKIERTPKYWQTAYVNYDAYSPTHEREVKQPIALQDEFLRAARLTVEVFTNSSPRFITRLGVI